MSKELDIKVAEARGECPHIWEWAPNEYDHEGCLIDNGDYVEKFCKKCKKRVAGLSYRVDGEADCLLYSRDMFTVWLLVQEMTRVATEFKMLWEEECWTVSGLVLGEAHMNNDIHFWARDDNLKIAICEAYLDFKEDK